MDPSEALAQIREGMPAALNSRSPAIARMAAAFDGLDTWMTEGGFLPDDWRPQTGRPRLEEDGVVLEGVVHGKPGSYNSGCRCQECRAGNRDRQASLRARRRMSTDPDLDHGDVMVYDMGCRCQPCHDAARSREVERLRA